MRKLVNKLFVFVSVLLFLAVPPRQTAQDLFYEYNYEVTFYSRTKLEDNSFNISDAGLYYIVSCDKSQEKEAELAIDDIAGKSFKFGTGEFDLQKFIKKYSFKIIFSQDFESTKVLYLYSDKLCGKKNINGKEVNLQVAITSSYIVAGSPVILGAY